MTQGNEGPKARLNPSVLRPQCAGDEEWAVGEERRGGAGAKCRNLITHKACLLILLAAALYLWSWGAPFLLPRGCTSHVRGHDLCQGRRGEKVRVTFLLLLFAQSPSASDINRPSCPRSGQLTLSPITRK